MQFKLLLYSFYAPPPPPHDFLVCFYKYASLYKDHWVITSTSPFNEHPENPIVYKECRVYREYTLFFLFWLKNIDRVYSMKQF